MNEEMSVETAPPAVKDVAPAAPQATVTTAPAELLEQPGVPRQAHTDLQKVVRDERRGLAPEKPKAAEQTADAVKTKTRGQAPGAQASTSEEESEDESDESLHTCKEQKRSAASRFLKEAKRLCRRAYDALPEGVRSVVGGVYDYSAGLVRSIGSYFGSVVKAFFTARDEDAPAASRPGLIFRLSSGTPSAPAPAASAPQSPAVRQAAAYEAPEAAAKKMVAEIATTAVVNAFAREEQQRREYQEQGRNLEVVRAIERVLASHPELRGTMAADPGTYMYYQDIAGPDLLESEVLARGRAELASKTVKKLSHA